jgi:hypothetical protein
LRRWPERSWMNASGPSLGRRRNVPATGSAAPVDQAVNGHSLSGCAAGAGSVGAGRDTGGILREAAGGQYHSVVGRAKCRASAYGTGRAGNGRFISVSLV